MNASVKWIIGGVCACGVLLMGMLVGFQAQIDKRQDDVLSATSDKLVSISIKMVEIAQALAEVKGAVTKEQALREAREREELSEYRRQQRDREREKR